MELGETFGDFIVFGPIGLGGMSTVYAAFDEGAKSLLALKLLRRQVDPGEHCKELFLREGDVYHELSHPNIVSFVTAGKVKDQAYIALELVRGSSLSSLIHSDEGGELSLDRAINLFLDLSRAVEHCHERGFIHRDLKPSNVIVTQDDMLKLIDFGLASSRQELAKDQGVIVGSPAYASPEQNRGEAVSERSDIYSLGTVFFEMLSRRRPFDGNSLEEIVGLQSQGAPKLGDLSKAIPEPIEGILAKLLDPWPLNRYSSVTEVIRALEDIKIKAKKGAKNFERVFDKVSEAWESAKLAYERGDQEGATFLASFYSKERPMDPRGHFLIAKLMAEQGKLEEARNHFTRAIAMDKFNVDYRIDFALHFYRLGKYRHSLEQIDAALGLRRNDWVLKGLEKLTFQRLPVRK